MPAFAPFRVRPARPGVLLMTLALFVGCGSESATPPRPRAPDVPPLWRLDPAVPESWVKPERWRGYWTIWADVRDFVGKERWKSLDTAWMARRAREDLATVTPEDDYDDIFILSGLWRLGMLREEVLRALRDREPEAGWPLVASDRSRDTGWRVRIQRWLRARPENERESALAEKLEATWKEAVTAADPKLASRVLEAREIWLGERTAPPAFRPDVERMVRKSLDAYLREYGRDWRYGRPPVGVIALMERFGAPEGVDLGKVAAAAAHYYTEVADAVMPLPHPYELNLRVQRLQRLQRGAGN